MTTTIKWSLKALVLTASAFVSTTASAGDFCQGKADGYYANPDNCAGYTVCFHDGQSQQVMTCPDGLLWNADGQYCDWADNVTCPVPESTNDLWIDEQSCNAFGGDLHWIHGYMADREESIELCEQACLESDYDCCQVDNDNFCYGSYTTSTVFNPRHTAIVIK